MKSFEMIEIAVIGVPTGKDVLAKLRRDAPCRADPLSCHCAFTSGKDDYLLRDVPGSRVCESCPLFEESHRKLTAEWEEWVLALQDVFT